MRRDELIHIIRAASQIWQDAGIAMDSPIAVIGSQSILLHHSDATLPDEMTYSQEADVFLIEHPDIETSDIVNGAIGEGSQFHETHGIYADAIDIQNVVLPNHWLERASIFDTDILDGKGTKVTIAALSPEDLIASKLFANRPKDREFVEAAIRSELIDNRKLLRSIFDLPVSKETYNALVKRYESLTIPKAVALQQTTETAYASSMSIYVNGVETPSFMDSLQQTQSVANGKYGISEELSKLNSELESDLKMPKLSELAAERNACDSANNFHKEIDGDFGVKQP